MDRAAKEVSRCVEAKAGSGDLRGQARLAYYAHLTGGGEAIPPEASIAFTIRGDEVQKEIVEALLLSDCPHDAAFSAFGVPGKALDIYRELFFDTSAFRTKLEKISYVENYPEGLGRELKMRALNLGYEYVLYTYGSAVPETGAQRELVRRLFASAAYRAMNINFAGMATTTARLAVKHAEVMLSAFNALEKSSDGAESGARDLVRFVLNEQPAAAANAVADSDIL